MLTLKLLNNQVHPPLNLNIHRERESEGNRLVVGYIYAKMAESKEINSAPITPRIASVIGTPIGVSSPPVSCPPSQFHSPSLSRSPLLHESNGSYNLDDVEHAHAARAPVHANHSRAASHGIQPSKTPKTPRTPRTPRLSNLTPRFITPLGSPMRKALRFTKLDPQDAWLPITESRNGNRYYAAFHTLCSGIGIQALVLPLAFTYLGWYLITSLVN